jgi:hypothetical protein
MRQILTAAGATTVTMSIYASVFAQAVPVLFQGEQYAAARLRLINAGWQRDGGDGSNACSFYSVMCKKYSEFSAASADGYCKFIWRDIDGRRLGITTYPCQATSAIPGPVTGWRWEHK